MILTGELLEVAISLNPFWNLFILIYVIITLTLRTLFKSNAINCVILIQTLHI